MSVMPETRGVGDEGPTILGASSASAGDAFRAVLDHPLLSLEESNLFGEQIYEGRLAAQQVDALPPDTDEAKRLAEVVERGLVARKVVASRHLRLVMGLANDFAYDNWRFDRDRRDEMIGVGNLALMQSFEGYVYMPDHHITAFARKCIINGLLLEVGKINREATGLSAKMRRQLRKVDAAYAQAVELDEETTYVEAAERVGVSKERLNTMLRLRSTATIRFDAALDPTDDSRSFLDIVEDTQAQHDLESVLNELALTQVWQAAGELRRRHHLSEREWLVLVGRYEAGFTQEELASELGFQGQGSVANLERQALDKVRREIENPGSVAKKSDKEFRIVETATDLLEVMGIEIEEDIGIVDTAAYILEHADLTRLQRETMKALLGVDRDGDPRRPHEVAKGRGVTYRAVYAAREAAMRRILAEWEKKRPASD